MPEIEPGPPACNADALLPGYVLAVHLKSFFGMCLLSYADSFYEPQLRAESSWWGPKVDGLPQKEHGMSAIRGTVVVV